jgi:peptide/nickel transport system permease protein
MITGTRVGKDPIELKRLRARRSLLATAWRDLRTSPWSARFGLSVVLIYIVLAVSAPLIAPFGEHEVVGESYAAWGGDFLLGTDQLGRDMLTRLIYGARNSMGIALLTAVLSFGVGGVLGVACALWRGWIDQIVSRLMDALMAIPTLIFALMMLSILGPSVASIVVVIGAIDSTRVFRLARAVAMNVVVLDFVEVAKLRGERIGWIMFREIMPNILPPLVAEFGLRYCFVFLTISALSFLGLGLQPPTADWGSMVRENATLITYGDITPLLPAGAIALLTVSVNFVVDWFLHKTSGLRSET